jgi:hypothetical protein
MGKRVGKGRPRQAVLAIALGLALLVAAAAVARDLGHKVGQETAKGDFATAVASGSATAPQEMSVKVTSKPKQKILGGNWNVVCSQGAGAGGNDGTFKGRTPIVGEIGLPYTNPDECTAAAGASLKKSGRLKVAIYANP